MLSKPIDLSVEIGPETFGPPSTNQQLQMERHHKGPGYWQVTHVSHSVHTGTHIDTPWHVFEDGATTSDVALTDIAGQGALFELSKAPSEPVTEEDLAKADPGLQPGRLAVLHTGWSNEMWGTFPDYYTKSPWLHESAAHWLVAHQAKAIVFDFFEEYCAREPNFTSEQFVVHRILLGAGIFLVEQGTGLNLLKGKNAYLYPAFYKLGNSDGAPARLFATTED